MWNSSAAQWLRSAAVPWPLLSAATAIAPTSSSPLSSTSSPHVGVAHLIVRGAAATTFITPIMPSFLRLPPSRASFGCTAAATMTSSLRTSLIRAATAAHVRGSTLCASHTQAVRNVSDDTASGDNKDEKESSSGSTAEASPASSDPTSVTASPRYTSHAAAEKVAYQQEDAVQRRDVGIQGSGDCHHDDHCGCGESSGDTRAKPGADTVAAGEAAARVSPRRPRDFGTVFHQEVAAWRAIHGRSGHHGGDCGKSSADGSSSTSPWSFETSRGGAPQRHIVVNPEDVPPGVTYEAYVEQLQAEEEMQRFLAQNTMHSIRRSIARDNAAANAEAVLTTSSRARIRLEPHQGYRGVQKLLDYNKQWAAEVSRFNPRYFIELAKEQKPEYLWIGCSDSRVPANEVIGLHPGDVFVHRNIGNIFSLSDLNCLSALQFAVDCLKVQHVIIAGHYKCGGVTAAMRGDNLGLTDHWIMQVADIKNKWWDRVLSDIPEEHHLSLLCELNVLEQLSHVVNCRIVQRRWKSQNANDRYYGRTTNNVYVRPEYATKHLSEKKIRNNLPTTVVNYEEELEVHGWVYSLDDGMLRPLLSLTRHSNVKKEIAEAIEALFIRYSQMV